MNRKRIKSDDNIDVNKIIGANLRFCRQMAGSVCPSAKRINLLRSNEVKRP